MARPIGYASSFLATFSTIPQSSTQVILECSYSYDCNYRRGFTLLFFIVLHSPSHFRPIVNLVPILLLFTILVSARFLTLIFNWNTSLFLTLLELVSQLLYQQSPFLNPCNPSKYTDHLTTYITPCIFNSLSIQ